MEVLGDGRARMQMTPAQWGPHFWMVLLLAIQRASPLLNADSVADLVNLFSGLKTTLPCDVCSTHYVAYWAQNPYTDHHARSFPRSHAWVSGLRDAIQQRVRRERAVHSRSDARVQAKRGRRPRPWRWLPPL